MTDAIQLASDVLLAGVPYALAFGLVRIIAFTLMALCWKRFDHIIGGGAE